MLRQFGEQIWIASGPEVVAAIGFHYPTRMVIIRLATGGLFVWSPVQLSDQLRAALEGLGPVQHLVAPNSLHHLFLTDWMRVYPEAKVYAAPGLRKKRTDIAFHADLGTEPDPHWKGEIDQVVVAGNAITTEVVFFHRKSGTVLFADLIQQFPTGWFSGWRSLVAKLDLMTGREPAVPRKFRIAFRDRAAARSAVARILDWPAEKVLMAHGAPVEAGGHAFLRRAFEWLMQ
jgi:hypothetical protein